MEVARTQRPTRCRDCGTALAVRSRGRPRLRCRRCNRRRQNARANHIPPGTTYRQWDRQSVARALAHTRARLDELRAAVRIAESDLARLEARLRYLEERDAAR